MSKDTDLKRNLLRWAEMIAAGEIQKALDQIKSRYTNIRSAPKIISQVKRIFFRKFAGMPSGPFLDFWAKWKRSKQAHPSAKRLITLIDGFIENSQSGDDSNLKLARFAVQAQRASPALEREVNGNRSLLQSLGKIPNPWPHIAGFRQNSADAAERKHMDAASLRTKMSSETGFVRLNGSSRYVFDRFVVDGLKSDDFHHQLAGLALCCGARFSSLIVYGQYRPIESKGPFWVEWSFYLKSKTIDVPPYQSPLLVAYPIFTSVLQRARSQAWAAYGVDDSLDPQVAVSRLNPGFNAWLRAFVESDPHLLQLFGMKKRRSKQAPEEQDGGALTRRMAKKQQQQDASPVEAYVEPPVEVAPEPEVAEPLPRAAPPPAKRQRRTKERAPEYVNASFHQFRSMYVAYCLMLFVVPVSAIAFAKQILGHGSDAIGSTAHYVSRPLHDEPFLLPGSENGYDRWDQPYQLRRPKLDKQEMEQEASRLDVLEQEVKKSAEVHSRNELLNKYLSVDADGKRLLVDSNLEVRGDVHAKAFKKRKVMP